jgi:hypothetical protein
MYLTIDLSEPNAAVLEAQARAARMPAEELEAAIQEALNQVRPQRVWQS